MQVFPTGVEKLMPIIHRKTLPDIVVMGEVS
ncbi:Hypothetical protein Tpal_2368 [Trichococcus palustris]|jgi:hypothetical protein|uniref:Uncharacterized protein n=1 Tax=Trichococcus palustris TaxID=140314 RepID=A0A143YUX2_9LACT|nr:Hypothetical protein Tpal_2368 [Trichococcus palustris]